MNRQITIRQAIAADLPSIMQILELGKKYMRLEGNMQQWSGAYPTLECMQQDIVEGNCFVCLHGEEIVACFSHLPGPDPYYAVIEEGEWPDARDYYVLHRIASSGRVSGVGIRVLDFCLRRYPVLRVDTHASNRTMRRLLESSGFKYCGIVHVADGTPRMAYQKDSDKKTFQHPA